MDIARLSAFEALLRIEEKKGYAALSVSEVLHNRPSASAPFVRHLVYGTLEYRLYLDHLLDKILTKGIKGTDARTRILLETGLYQLRLMDGVPDFAAVKETVTLTGRLAPGKKALVNGVLRTAQRMGDALQLSPDDGSNDWLSVRYSVGKSVLKACLSGIGRENTVSLLKHSFEKKGIGLRVNTAGASGTDDIGALKDSLKKELENDGIVCTEPPACTFPGSLKRSLLAEGHHILDHPAYRAGRFSVQSAESCSIADLTQAAPGMDVLDLCAAPGGKSCAMAERMAGKGSILSCDIYPARIALIEKERKRLSLSVIHPLQKDATVRNTAWEGRFDLVLADVPCSGLGVLRSKPEIKYKELDDLPALWRMQEKILENAAFYLKSGGQLVYATCTVLPRENEELVHRFLAEHKDFVLMDELQHAPYLDGMDGFYAALLERSICGHWL